MRMFVSIVAGLVLATAVPATAHIAAGTVNLTAAEEVPPPTGVPANAGGTAELTLEEDKTLVYEVTVHDLSGSAIAAHIHEGAPGVAGPIVFPLTQTSGTVFSGTTAALTDDQVAKFLTGDYYVNVHTALNQAGEIRGQIFRGACSCKTAASKQAFRKCVRDEIKKLEKKQKKTAAIRALKKAVNKSACGLTAAPGKKQSACCLTTQASYIVSGQLCVPVKKETQCRGGTFIADSPCAPNNPCERPASPSGAFVD
jgi:hypothetical protein